MTCCCFSAPVFLFSVLVLADCKDVSRWTCKDGFWHEGSKKSTYTCKAGGTSKTGKGTKAAACNMTHMIDGAMKTAVEGLPRTCIAHPTNSNGGRCWWTYVPNAVATATDKRKVPLVVDMHGGGGCAGHQLQSSSFKALADTEAAKVGGGMIVVWPQGGSARALNNQWSTSGSCKGHCADKKATTVSNKKDIADWDDVGFLELLIANMVELSKHKDKIDVERVYMSGFSMGCMMSNRFALERSKIVAAFGCEGGDLTYAPTTKAHMDADKSAYNLQAMPAYLSIGDQDGWFAGAKRSFDAWAYFNGCTGNDTTSLKIGDKDAVEHVSSSCAIYTPALQTVMVEIKEMRHVPYKSASERIWNFVKKYKRKGALANLLSVTTTTQTTTTVPGENSSATTRPQASGGRVLYPMVVVCVVSALAGIDWGVTL